MNDEEDDDYMDLLGAVNAKPKTQETDLDALIGNAKKDEDDNKSRLKERVGSSRIIGCPVAHSHFDIIPKVHKFMMNKSGIFIIENSKITNHKIPSNGDRLLIISLDLSGILKDECGNLISLQMQGCTKGIKDLLKIFNDVTISYDSKSKRYSFSNQMMDIDIAKLDDEDKELYLYDLDIFEETYIDFNYQEPKSNPESETDRAARIQSIISEQGDLIRDGVLSLLKKDSPIDLLIKQHKVIGFQQGTYIISTQDNVKVLRTDADFILRSHNFYFFHNKHPSDDGLLRVIKNGDNEFWLQIEGDYCGFGVNTLKTLENLELLMF